MVESLSIRAVVFQEKGRWVAQCLESDLCTSATGRKELTRKLVAQLRLQIMLDLAKKKRPFQDLPQAPRRFWEMYSGGTPEEVVQVRDFHLGRLSQIWRGRSRIQIQLTLATLSAFR